MQIHTKLPGESVKQIAENYSVSEEIIRRINQLGNEEAADGEELLILIPTRTYKVQHGDTPEKIALRFGMRVRDIYSLNPWIDDELKAGETIALKYSEPKGGMAVANGYFYKGCDIGALKRAMPYLTYVTFAEGVADERGIRRTADFAREIAYATEEKKIPLLRVFDRHLQRYKSGGDHTTYAEELIRLALSSGYKGIVLDSCPLSNSAEEFSSFLMILRKLMIGSDLILITEVNEYSPLEFSEYADGSVIYYPKYASDNAPSFNEGERKLLSDFACRGESAKVFIDLPSLARREKEYITVDEALKKARRGGCDISTNESTLLSHFRDRKQGEYIFSSLKNIRSLLELINEYDYMGVCFDIMRTPLSHLMMYSSMFKTSYYNSVRTREGCSRVGEE